MTDLFFKKETTISSNTPKRMSLKELEALSYASARAQMTRDRVERERVEWRSQYYAQQMEDAEYNFTYGRIILPKVAGVPPASLQETPTETTKVLTFTETVKEHDTEERYPVGVQRQEPILEYVAEQEVCIVSAPREVPLERGDSQTSFHARHAHYHDDGEYPHLEENREVEIQQKTGQWGQLVHVADPQESLCLEAGSGVVMPYARSHPPIPSYAPRHLPSLPPCYISIFGEIHPLNNSNPLALLRAAQRKGPAHLVVSTAQDVDLLVDSVYAPYLAVRIGELHMPRMTLAVWHRGGSRYPISVYWSETDTPNSGVLSRLELPDTRPLVFGKYVQFPFRMLLPVTLRGILRRAFYTGSLYAIDIEGDLSNVRDTSVLRMCRRGVTSVPLASATRSALFVGKGAYLESQFLKMSNISPEFTERESGLVDIEGYVPWLPESKGQRGGEHNAIDGTAQIAYRVAVFIGVFSEINYESGPFKEAYTMKSLKMKFTVPELHRNVFIRQSVQFAGVTDSLTRRSITADVKFSKNVKPFVGNEDQCHRVDIGQMSKEYQLSAYGYDVVMDS